MYIYKSGKYIHVMEEYELNITENNESLLDLVQKEAFQVLKFNHVPWWETKVRRWTGNRWFLTE